MTLDRVPADTSDVAAAKVALRVTARAARKDLLHGRAGAAAAAAGHFLVHIPMAHGAVVSAYLPRADEFDPLPLVASLLARGHVVVMPVVAARAQPLVFRRWTPQTATVAGAMAIAEPGPDSPELVPDVLIVPLLQFDAQGWRLGYGGGYYDRTLQHLRRHQPRTLAIGLGFAGQEVASVPHDALDQRLDWIVTEAGARPVAAKGARHEGDLPGGRRGPVRP
ncbi:5-formyltetrahydrofolate cyclo-ligase [Zavarzinia sp. CC-PAN008]|uniref:5-formyltetrahydrofolate cyclo-ligase n=1 Tax=Zavarzinia sp. CC-PAN008 TaxID=3243332 RepID=UPI003F744E3C